MRFSSVVAFMLPLSALAAPLVQRASIDDLRDQILSGLTIVGQELPTVLQKGQDIQIFSQKAVVNDIVNVAKVDLEKFDVVVTAAKNIAKAIQDNKAPEEKEYVDTPNAQSLVKIITNPAICLCSQAFFSVNILQIQVDLGKLQAEIVDAISPNPKDGNKLPQGTIDAINGLTGDLNSAKSATDTVVVAGCALLAAQGKDLKTLLDEFGFAVPVGASCPPQ